MWLMWLWMWLGYRWRSDLEKPEKVLSWGCISLLVDINCISSSYVILFCLFLLLNPCVVTPRLPPASPWYLNHVDDEWQRRKDLFCPNCPKLQGVHSFKVMLVLNMLDILCWPLVSQARPLFFVPQHQSLSVCGAQSILKVIGAAEQKVSDLRD